MHLAWFPSLLKIWLLIPYIYGHTLDFTNGTMTDYRDTSIDSTKRILTIHSCFWVKSEVTWRRLPTFWKFSDGEIFSDVSSLTFESTQSKMLHIELLQFLEQSITPLMREMVIFYRTTLAILFQGNTREKQTSNNLSNVGSQRIFLWNKIFFLKYSLSKNHISLIFELRKNKNKSTFRSWATKGNNIEWKNFEFNNFNRVRDPLLG